MEAGCETDVDENGRAVSNVIGVVMLVGIVVILVGVTAVYLTGFGEEIDKESPRLVGTSTEFNSEHAGNGQYLNITHIRGDIIETEGIEISVKDARAVDPGTDEKGVSYDANVIEDQHGDELKADNTIVLDQRHFVDDSGDRLDSAANSNYYLDLTEATVMIIWNPQTVDQSDIIYSCKPEEPNCEQT